MAKGKGKLKLDTMSVTVLLVMSLFGGVVGYYLGRGSTTAQAVVMREAATMMKEVGAMMDERGKQLRDNDMMEKGRMMIDKGTVMMGMGY